jgi:hypothetical protein
LTFGRAAQTLGAAIRGHPDGICGRRVHPVGMTTRAVKITLELRLAGDELDGRASDEDGLDRPFSGWLGLLVTLDSLLEAAPEAAQRS